MDLLDDKDVFESFSNKPLSLLTYLQPLLNLLTYLYLTVITIEPTIPNNNIIDVIINQIE